MAAYPPRSDQQPPYQPQPSDPYALEVMPAQHQQYPYAPHGTPYQQPPLPGPYPQQQQPPTATYPYAPQGMPYQQPPLRATYIQSPFRYTQQPAGPYAQKPAGAPLQQSRSSTASDANDDDIREPPKGLVVVAVLIAISSVATVMGACIDTVPVIGSIFVVTEFGGAGCPMVLLNAFFLFAISGVASFLTALLVLANGARGRTRCLYGTAIAFEVMSSLVYVIAPAVITAMTLMLMTENYQSAGRKLRPYSRIIQFNGAKTLKDAFESCRGQPRYSVDKDTHPMRDSEFIGTFCDVCYKPYIVAFSLLWIFWMIGLVLRITYIVLICRAMKKLPA